MSDDDEKKASLERWRKRLEAGIPISEFIIDDPFEVQITEEGAVALKFVYGQLGNFEIASMALAILTPAAARRPKAILLTAENIPDTPLPMPEPRSRN